MDTVLCIDISVEPARASLVSVEENKLTILESRQFSLRKDLNLPDLMTYNFIEGVASRSADTDGQESETPESEAAPIDQNIRYCTPLSPLVSAINDLPKTWTNSVLIIPMNEYLSLNLPLPFSDQNNISKILDLEVQDVVPFDIDEFIVEGHSITQLESTQYDVHVSLIPKRLIRNIIAFMRASGIDPAIITTPCSSLATIPLLATDFFSDTYALVSVTPDAVYFCAAINDLVRTDKVLVASGAQSDDGQWFIPELKLHLMSLEKSYNKTFRTVYVNASQKVITQLQQTLGRTIESFDFSDFVQGPHKEGASSVMPALYAGEQTTQLPLTNFRVREFSFRPNWAALFRSLAQIKYYFLGFAGFLLFTTFATYQVRNLQISRLRSAVQEQIRKTIPNIKGGPGNEVPAFFGELQTLSKELESLGSSNEISPMNILVELTKELKDQKDAKINEIDIRPDKVILNVSVPDYAAADKIERVLKKRKEIFRRIRKDASSNSSSAGGRTFNFEIKLLD